MLISHHFQVTKIFFRHLQFSTLLFALLCVSNSIVCLQVQASTTEKSLDQLEQEKKERQIESEKLDLEIKRIQLEKQRRDLVEFTPPNNRASITSKSQTIEATIQSHKALYQVAVKVFDDVMKAKHKSKYIIVSGANDAPVQYLNAYRNYKFYIDYFSQAYKQILEPDNQQQPLIPGSPSLVLGSFTTLLNIFSLFRQDVVLEGVKVQPTYQMFASFLASQAQQSTSENSLQGKTNESNLNEDKHCLPNAFNDEPYIYYPVLSEQHNLSCAKDFFSELSQLQNYRNKAEQDKDKNTALNQINTAYDEFTQTIYQPNNFNNLVKGRRIENMLNSGGNFLYIVSLESEGTNQIRSNFFGNSITYSGGASIIYEIRDSQDNLIFAGNAYSHSGFDEMTDKVTEAINSNSDK